MHTAYKRGDKVILQRSQSEAMNKFVISLLKADKPNPFLKEISSLSTLQARVYSETDHLLPEEQWAQITVRFSGTQADTGARVTQYSVFERRLADKLSYMDWKLAMLADEEDFALMHSKDVK